MEVQLVPVFSGVSLLCLSRLSIPKPGPVSHNETSPLLAASRGHVQVSQKTERSVLKHIQVFSFIGKSMLNLHCYFDCLYKCQQNKHYSRIRGFGRCVRIKCIWLEQRTTSGRPGHPVLWKIRYIYVFVIAGPSQTWRTTVQLEQFIAGAVRQLE